MSGLWGRAGWNNLTRSGKERLTDEWEAGKLAEWAAAGRLRPDGSLAVAADFVGGLSPAEARAVLLGGHGYRRSESTLTWKVHGNYGKGRRTRRARR